MHSWHVLCECSWQVQHSLANPKGGLAFHHPRFCASSRAVEKVVWSSRWPDPHPMCCKCSLRKRWLQCTSWSFTLSLSIQTLPCLKGTIVVIDKSSNQIPRKPPWYILARKLSTHGYTGMSRYWWAESTALGWYWLECMFMLYDSFIHMFFIRNRIAVWLCSTEWAIIMQALRQVRRECSLVNSTGSEYDRQLLYSVYVHSPPDAPRYVLLSAHS